MNQQQLSIWSFQKRTIRTLFVKQKCCQQELIFPFEEQEIKQCSLFILIVSHAMPIYPEFFFLRITCLRHSHINSSSVMEILKILLTLHHDKNLSCGASNFVLLKPHCVHTIGIRFSTKIDLCSIFNNLNHDWWSTREHDSQINK